MGTRARNNPRTRAREESLFLSPSPSVHGGVVLVKGEGLGGRRHGRCIVSQGVGVRKVAGIDRVPCSPGRVRAPGNHGFTGYPRELIPSDWLSSLRRPLDGARFVFIATGRGMGAGERGTEKNG